MQLIIRAMESLMLKGFIQTEWELFMGLET